MKGDLLTKYFEYHPDFELELNLIQEPNRKKFKKKLHKETQKANFLSTISEFKFAKFLELENLEYTYEPKIAQNKTPDFGLEINNSNTFFDVKRFNISDNDKEDGYILSDLCNELELIKKPYAIDVQQISKSLEIDVDLAKQEIEKWLLSDEITPYSSYIYDDQLQIDIIGVHDSCENIIFMFTPNTPKIHPSKIKSDIIKKLESYNEAIIESNIPFFVAIDLTFDTLIDPRDYMYFFMASPSINNSYVLGEFYNDKKLNGLTGILISYNTKFYWINNPRNSFEICFKNTETEYKINSHKI